MHSPLHTKFVVLIIMYLNYLFNNPYCALQKTKISCPSLWHRIFLSY